MKLVIVIDRCFRAADLQRERERRMQAENELSVLMNLNSLLSRFKQFVQQQRRRTKAAGGSSAANNYILLW